MGFVIAFALSTATIIYTGLNVRAPGALRTEQEAAQAPADLADAPDDEGPEIEEPESEAAER